VPPPTCAFANNTAVTNTGYHLPSSHGLFAGSLEASLRICRRNWHTSRSNTDLSPSFAYL